jgi:hypothetical protein
MSETVNASPTKKFFVSTITRDLTVLECILDLVDNCIDGARNYLNKVGKLDDQSAQTNYESFCTRIEMSDDHFEIKDNCGGISLDKAINYAFRFGRDPDEYPEEASHSIGLYGIGMKRAIFKLGQKSTVISQTEEGESFEIGINIEDWLSDDKWDFELETVDRGEMGTTIRVDKLNDGIGRRLANSSFESELRRALERDYAFVLKNGFEIYLNGEKVAPFRYTYRRSHEIRPVRKSFSEDGVRVEMWSGMIHPPPQDVDAEFTARKKTDYYGWFVVCNDRVVLAADTTDRTVWGDGDFPSWHGQYNGFLGVVKFESDDPSKLPWTSTKRDVDEENSIYSNTVQKMKEATRPFIDYTNDRKEDVEEAKAKEEATEAVEIEDVEENENMRLPSIDNGTTARTSIQYRKKKDLVEAVADALGVSSNAEVGRRTFDYYVSSENIE